MIRARLVPMDRQNRQYLSRNALGMKLLCLLLVTLALGISASGQVTNRSLAPESFLALKLSEVKINAASVMEAWAQVCARTAKEYPEIPGISSSFVSVPIDSIAEDAKPQRMTADIKLELRDVTIRELAEQIAVLGGVAFIEELNGVRFACISTFDASNKTRYYIWMPSWTSVFGILSTDEARSVAAKLSEFGVTVRVLEFEKNTKVLKLLADDADFLLLEALLRVARQGMTIEKQK